MRVIIAGSRGIRDIALVEAAVSESGFSVSTVVSGTAAGVDRLGEEWATRRNIPVERYPADWDRYGKRAGHIRNRKMAENADALVAVWDGVSRGTANMIEQARAMGLKVHIYLRK